MIRMHIDFRPLVVFDDG